MAESITVEVAFALASRQLLVLVSVAEGATVAHCIEQSGIADRFSGLEYSDENVGIYGQHCSLNREVRDGDRIEIYRPLQKDPKELRRLRARQQAEAAAREKSQESG